MQGTMRLWYSANYPHCHLQPGTMSNDVCPPTEQTLEARIVQHFRLSRSTEASRHHPSSPLGHCWQRSARPPGAAAAGPAPRWLLQGDGEMTQDSSMLGV